MFWNKQRQIERLENSVDSLKDDAIRLRQDNMGLRTVRVDCDIEMEALKQYHRLAIADLVATHNREIFDLTAAQEVVMTKLEKKVEVLERDFNFELRKAVSKDKESLRKQANEQDRKFADKVKKLEAEYAAKMAKLDTKLESDKASYRKYVRQENNTKLDTLEKENKRLVVENATLTGKNQALEVSQKFFSGKQEAGGEIITQLIKALPTVSAEITTPEINVVGTPTSAPKPQQDQQKKN